MTLSASDPLLRPLVLEALFSVYDPEIPVNIYDLGLVYEVDISPENFVTIKMTLTAPGCPSAQSLPIEVEQKVGAIPGVSGVKVEVVWDPPWTPEMMPETVRLQLGLL